MLLVRAEDSKHPVRFLEAVVASETALPVLRINAATALVRLPKYNTRYISKVVDLPPPTSVPEAVEQIAQIAGLVRLKMLGIEEGDALIGQLGVYITAQQSLDHEARIAALEERDRQRGPPPPVIEIRSEMPLMPGLEDLKMPELATAPAEPSNPWAGGPEKPE
jgi:hypothetical protein